MNVLKKQIHIGKRNLAGRNERKEKAEKHHSVMEERYATEIWYSVRNSRIFDANECELLLQGNGRKKPVEFGGNITVKRQRVEDAVRDNAERFGNAVILNFASFVSPGGGFIRGAIAQEEALCHASTLYNVEIAVPSFYDYNREHLHKDLYEHRILYLPKIVFVNKEEDEVCKCDVLTCAAPYKVAAMMKGVSGPEADRVMRERVCLVLECMAQMGKRVIVIGPFGCGVFGNDIEMVADTFRQELKKYPFDVYCPITGEDSYEVFKRVLH